MKIGVIVGHEKKAPGAKLVETKLYEYQFNTDIAFLMADRAQSKKIDFEVFFRDDIGIHGAYRKARAAQCTCVIELHFNAATGQAYGTETLCSKETLDKSFAAAVHNAVCKVFMRLGKADRGIKVLDSDDRGGTNVVSFPGKANCLVEPFFGDNPLEARFAIERKREYADALVDACVDWFASL